MDRRSFLKYIGGAVGSLFVLPKIFAKEKQEFLVGYCGYQEHGKTKYIVQINSDGTYTPEKMMCYKCGAVERTEAIQNWALMPKGSLCPNCVKYLYSDEQVIELIDKSTYVRVTNHDFHLTGSKKVAKNIIQNEIDRARSVCLGFDHNYDYDKYMNLYRHGPMWLLN